MRRAFRQPLGKPGRAGIWTHFRFNPGVFVILATALAGFYVLGEAIPAFIVWHYRSTYRQVDFVMGQAEENSGWPLVRGRLEPPGEEWVLPLRTTPSGYVLETDPAVSFAPGRRVRVWWSEAAPGVGYGRGRSTNIMPVTAFPRVPGLGRFLAWMALLPVIGVAGLWVLSRPVFRPRGGVTETLLDEEKPDGTT